MPVALSLDNLPLLSAYSSYDAGGGLLSSSLYSSKDYGCVEHDASRAAGDPFIVQRLRSISEHAAAWSSIMLDLSQVESHLNQHGDAHVIYPCLRHARELVRGIRPGSDVRIDMRTTSDTNQDADESLACLRTALFSNSTPAVRISFTGGKQHALRATLSREAYDRWLNVFRKSTMNQTLTSYLSFGAGV